MARTRSALETKVGALEERARDQARKVRDRFESAKQSVKNSVNLAHHVRQHPWPAFGASVLVGVVLAGVTRRRDPAFDRPRFDEGFGASHLADHAPVATKRGMFAEELHQLRRTGVGAVMALVKKGLRNKFPGTAAQTDRIIDGMTRKLGGDPMEPIFDEAHG
jgi:hypothetical protein